MWVSGLFFNEIVHSTEVLKEKYGITGLRPSYAEGYSYVYAITNNSGHPLYFIPDMTESFMDAKDAEGTFSGIRMKKMDGSLYFNEADLMEKDIKYSN